MSRRLCARAGIPFLAAVLGGFLPPAVAAQGLPAPTYTPRAHHEVLEYFRKLWTGKPRDAAFEARTLDDLGFRVLNLAELIVAMCAEIDLPVDKAVDFVSIGASPTPLPEGILTRKVAILAEAFSEEDRAKLVLADPQMKAVALAPMAPPVDTVERLIRYCMAVEKWCREDRPSRFPALVTAGSPGAPPHMAGRHAEDVAPTTNGAGSWASHGKRKH